MKISRQEIKRIVWKVVASTPIVRNSAHLHFRTRHYMRHNQRRLEHLAQLNLPIVGRTVLEVGAGIGDHTSFFLDRGCQVTVTDGRPRNIRILRQTFPQLVVTLLDLDNPDPNFEIQAEIVYCYGTLYHLSRPSQALEFLAQHCLDLLLLETCVSFGTEASVNPVRETAYAAPQAVSGVGCRPTRTWIYQQLRHHFPFVYLPLSQPSHEEFPLDWTQPASGLNRAVFIASRNELDNPMLSVEMPLFQIRA